MRPFISGAVAAIVVSLFLTACAIGPPAEYAFQRQEVANQLDLAESDLIELTTQYQIVSDTSDEDEEARQERLAELQEAIQNLQTLIDGLQAQLDQLTEEIESFVAGNVPTAPGPGFAQTGQAPIVTYEREDFLFGTQTFIHVGADAASGARLAGAGSHRPATLYYGSVSDGVSKERLVAYLQADAATYVTGVNPQGFIRRFGEEPPTVSLVIGATERMIEETREAVRIINAALPPEWQLVFSDDPQTGVLRPEDGNILVEFAHRSAWPGSHPLTVVGAARTWLDAIRNPDFDETSSDPGNIAKFQIATLSSGRIWIDHTRVSGEQRMQTLVHELIHTLGRNHADKSDFPLSVMVEGGGGKPGYVLHPLDRDALLAVYGRLEPHTLPEDIASELGPWETTALQIRGNVRHFGNVDFGVTLRNGVAEPWAYGPEPRHDLEDNFLIDLSVSLTWAGRLVGLTPDAESVAGKAVLVLDTSDLDGELSLTELEKWPVRSAPEAIGTGETWGDGDLRYVVSVDGNSFVQTAGDEGSITGSFFGDSHYLMGGVLTRNDLAAAFGGER